MTKWLHEFTSRPPGRMLLKCYVLLTLSAFAELLTRYLVKHDMLDQLPRDAASLTCWAVVGYAAVSFIKGAAGWRPVTALVTLAFSTTFFQQLLIVTGHYDFLDRTWVLGSNGLLHDPLREVAEAVGLILFFFAIIYLIYEMNSARWDAERRSEELATALDERDHAETERGKLEGQLLQTQKLEGIGVLAGGVAHDFNNLLVGILGNAMLVRDDLDEDSEQRAMCDDVITSARRASELCQQLLAYAGKGRTEVAPCDISRLVRESRKLLNLSTSGSGEIVYDLDNELPAVEVDLSQFQQVVMNLVANAAESLPKDGGAIQLRTAMRDFEAKELITCFTGGDALAPGSYVVLEVEDNGCGIAGKDISCVLEPFYTSKDGGHGLGLAATYGIVRVHGGGIIIDSEVGRGTRVQVLFAASEKPVAEVMPPTPQTPPEQDRGLVLVVDDEPIVRYTARRVLARNGYDILEAANGLEGVRAFEDRSAEIRAVLLDIKMPGMDGAEVCKHLREIDSSVPVIVCTGYGDEEAYRQLGEQRVDGIIAKPFSSDDLINAIKATRPGVRPEPLLRQA